MWSKRGSHVQGLAVGSSHLGLCRVTVQGQQWVAGGAEM